MPTHKTQIQFSLRWILPLLLLLVVISCKRPVIKIVKIPENTPEGASLFAAGNFNRWDAGDVRFKFDLDQDSNYLYTLPRGFGNIEFKVTRGEWLNAETDICGYDISNRIIDYASEDTISIEILSWKDTEAINCPELTIVVKNLPENTPMDEPIALAGNFNEWSPDSSSYLQRDTQSGRYMIKLPRKDMDRLIEFKVTRGNLSTAEADKFGYELERRQIKFGLVDTLFIDVESWEDIEDLPRDRVVIILDQIPRETPVSSNIFLTGSFNGWYPKDNKYQFQINEKGKYQYILPREEDIVEFKITRGDWSKEETDLLGYKMDNRRFEFGSADTLHINIHGWLDQSEIIQPTYTFIIDEVPPNTPDGDQLYLAGSFNNWNAGRRKYRFSKADDGKYYLTFQDTWPSIDYKVSRGSWRSEEVGKTGQKTPNRHFTFTGQDTVHLKIENWIDIPRFNQSKVTIVLDKVPQNTPLDQQIYITGSFNDWNPEDSDYILNKNSQDKPYITLNRRSDEIEFKFTLGSWEFEELDENGFVIGNRSYRFGYADTLYLKVEQWEYFGN